MPGKETQPTRRFSREALIDIGAPLIGTAVEKGIRGTSIEFPQGFSEEFNQAIAQRNEKGQRKYSIFIISRHNSHPDGFIIAKLASNLKARANDILPSQDHTKGFIMPLAQSLEEGQQNRLMMKVYHRIKPTLKSFGIVPAPIVREKDRQVYGMEKDGDSDARMRELLNDGYNGVVLFPEGTTTGGKTNENGQLIGMVPFESNSIRRTYLFLKRNLGTESLIIPTATFGGRELLNPNDKWVSPSLFLTALLSPQPRIAKIKVGMPLRSDSGELAHLLKNSNFAGLTQEERKSAKENDAKALNDYIGHTVASLIPERERGVYREKVIFPGGS